MQQQCFHEDPKVDDAVNVVDCTVGRNTCFLCFWFSFLAQEFSSMSGGTCAYDTIHKRSPNEE